MSRRNRPPRSRSRNAVISPTGRRATRLVGALRLASAGCAAATFVAIGRIVDGEPDAGVAALVLAVAAAACAAGEIAFGGRAARAEERRVRSAVLRRVFTVDPTTDIATGRPADASRDAGHIVQLLTDNTERVTEYRQVYLGATIAAMLVPFMVLAYIGLAIDPVVGFVVMALCPLIPILIRGFMLLFRRTSADSRRQRALLSARYLDAIRNLVTIRLFGAGPRIEHDLRVHGEANRGAIMRLLAGNQVVIIVMDGLFALVLICVTGVLTIARADDISSGQAVTIMLLTALLLEPLQQVAGFFYIGMGGLASQKALAAFLSSADTSRASRPPAQQADIVPATAGLAVELRDVAFDYGRGPVLADVDLDVPDGARVAVVGPSGAGKSTLLGLLRGALAPQSGSVFVEGRPVDDTDAATARALSATVAQSTWMFTGTVADNLRLAQPGATDEQMWRALELAHVAEDVARMPARLDTPVGERAGLVSGGQAQRISLARALLSGRRLLLLDEPTSQVDIESESRIIAAIADLPRDRTVLMVTHRPALLDIADDVYRLADGRLSRTTVSA